MLCPCITIESHLNVAKTVFKKSFWFPLERKDGFLFSKLANLMKQNGKSPAALNRFEDEMQWRSKISQFRCLQWQISSPNIFKIVTNAKNSLLGKYSGIFVCFIFLKKKATKNYKVKILMNQICTFIFSGS